MVVAHQTIGMTMPALLFHLAPEQFQKTHPVGVVGENGLSGVAPRGDMVDGAGEFEAERTRHEARTAGRLSKVNC